MRKLCFGGMLVVLLCLAGFRLLGEATAPAEQPQEEAAIQLLSPSPTVEPVELVVGKAS